MAQQRSFARAVYDRAIQGPNWKVIDETGSELDRGNQEFGHTREGRAVRLHEAGSPIATVIDYQHPFGSNVYGPHEKLAHVNGGMVTRIGCKALRMDVVATDITSGTEVSNIGQGAEMKADLFTNRPSECPLTTVAIGSRALSNFAACFDCDYASVDRYAIYRV
jgi:hypothetical protein